MFLLPTAFQHQRYKSKDKRVFEGGLMTVHLRNLCFRPRNTATLQCVIKFNYSWRCILIRVLAMSMADIALLTLEECVSITKPVSTHHDVHTGKRK
jgi:hypothetical protein